MWKIIELALQRYEVYKNIQQGYETPDLENFVNNALINRNAVIAKYPSIIACMIRYGVQKERGKSQHREELVEFARETQPDQLFNDITLQMEELETNYFNKMNEKFIKFWE